MRESGLRPLSLKVSKNFSKMLACLLVVDFKTVCKMLINQDQPLEAFLACYTLVNTGAWASTVPVEGPRSTSPRWKGLGPHHLFR